MIAAPFPTLAVSSAPAASRRFGYDPAINEGVLVPSTSEPVEIEATPYVSTVVVTATPT